MKRAILQVLKQYVWIVGLLLIACPSTSPARGTSAGSGRVGAQPVIRITVYNYAHIDRRELREAERQAADLFARAGVRIAWLSDSQKGGSVLSRLDHSNADFSVRIVYAFMSKRMHQSFEANTLGESTVSVGTDGPTAGGVANVYYDRVKEVSERWSLFSGQVLGDAITHELGHLMLGVHHSGQGIMKAHWNSRDLHMASQGRLRFLPSQVALLQSAALEMHSASSPMVLARR